MLKTTCRWGTFLSRREQTPFPEFHHPLLMAGWAEMTALAGEGRKIFMAAIPGLYPGKAVVQVTAVQVPVNDLLQVGAPETVRPFEPLLVDLNKGFKWSSTHSNNQKKIAGSGDINGGGSG